MTDARPGAGVPVLQIRDATLVRGGVRVLERLTLTVRSGEHTAILGPNGAGKTSLMRMLTLEDRPLVEHGAPPPLLLFGRDRWDLMALRRHLGVVSGDLEADFGRWTSRGRVSGLDAALSGLLGSEGVFAHHEITDAMRALAHTALGRVEAAHLAGKRLTEMSAGERRRVLIARALVTEPHALLLDEPTTGLDVVARHRFMESVRRLAQAGTTVILVTHHVEEIIPEIARVVLLREGRVAFDGPTAEALTGARLGEVFGGAITVERNGGYYSVRVG
jgi:iron complex transport system ATP-binding protein